MTNESSAFESVFQFLAMTFSWLAARVRRIEVEKRLREATGGQGDFTGKTVGESSRVGDDELRRQLDVIQKEENRLKEELEAGLNAYRGNPANPNLPIDELCDQAGLSQEERTILQVLAFPAIHPGRATVAYEGVGTGYYQVLSVSDIIEILDVKGIEGWVRARRFFRWDSPLVREGLIVLHFSTKDATPVDFLDASVRLTRRGLAAVLGDASLASECGDVRSASDGTSAHPVG